MKKTKIAIVTTLDTDWGGSEDVWAVAVPYLLAAGYVVTVYKKNLHPNIPQFRNLTEMGVFLEELNPPPTPEPAAGNSNFLERVFSIKKEPRSQRTITNVNSHLSYLLQGYNPKIVIISQGMNFDGLAFAAECHLLNMPYILLAQKAVESCWPIYQTKAERDRMKMVYLNAKKVYFVSRHTKRITEEQFGIAFPNTELIINPIKVPRVYIPIPDMNKGVRLACIGRYYLLDKGQDILIRIMAKPKWKERALTVSFIGSGVDLNLLQELARFLGATNVLFQNPVDDIVEVWKNYHGLILPSRNEGSPLVLREAMACGRVVIVSDAGGNAELIENGYNAFIGQANEKSFEEAMERAWAMRERWDEMGQMGLETIISTVPENPERLFAASMIKLINNL